MKGKRYSEEFKRDAVKQVTERGYSVGEVAKRPLEMAVTIDIYQVEIFST